MWPRRLRPQVDSARRQEAPPFLHVDTLEFSMKVCASAAAHTSARSGNQRRQADEEKNRSHSSKRCIPSARRVSQAAAIDVKSRRGQSGSRVLRRGSRSDARRGANYDCECARAGGRALVASLRRESENVSMRASSVAAGTLARARHRRLGSRLLSVASASKEARHLMWPQACASSLFAQRIKRSQMAIGEWHATPKK